MAGINSDITRIADWIAAGIEGAGLLFKRPSNLDDGGHSYALVRPPVFAHAYPTNRIEDALPSALVELQSVAWTPEAVIYELALTLAVWDSGTHAPDVYHKTETPGVWAPGTGDAYQRADGARGATIDLCTFGDALSRFFRREAQRIGDGLQLDLSDGVQLELITEDELSRSGFRFGRFALTVRDPLPPAPMAGTQPTDDRAEADSAAQSEITAFL